MLRWIRRHGETVVVAGVTALVVSGAPALGHVTKKLGHIVKHLNPLFVNVGEKASDSDLLDGKDSTAFLGSGAKAADADRLDGADSTAFMRVGDTASDSDRLDGMDSTAFLGATDTAADSDLLDGLDSTAFQSSYDRTVVVSTAAELLSAVGSVGPGALIKLEPGVYNIGSNVLQVPSGVDLEGSGERRTTIVRGGFADDTQATVIGASGSEVRFLTINSSGGANAIAVRAPAGFALVHATAFVQNGTTLNVAVDLVDGGGSSPAVLFDVSASTVGASGVPSYGIRASRPAVVRHSSVSGFDLTFAAGTGILVNAGTSLTVEGSVVVGGTDAIGQTAGTVRVGGSRLEGGVTGAVTCAGVWDGAFTFFDSTCPT